MADAPAAPKNPRDYSDLLETNNTDAFAFSDREKLVLGLYHQLTELELQRSLLEAQNEGSYGIRSLGWDIRLTLLQLMSLTSHNYQTMKCKSSWPSRSVKLWTRG